MSSTDYAAEQEAIRLSNIPFHVGQVKHYATEARYALANLITNLDNVDEEIAETVRVRSLLIAEKAARAIQVQS
jgi:hypothetical protein